MNKNKFLMFAVVLSFSTLANASSLYSQAISLNNDGGPYSYSNQKIYDKFSLTTNNSVGGITWYGDNFANQFPATQSFQISFFNDTGDMPSSNALYTVNVLATATSTGMSTGGESIYSFSADFNPVALSGGTSYWLSILDTSPTASDGNTLFRWANGTSNTSDSPNYFTNGGQLRQMDSSYRRAQAAYTLNSPDAPSAVPLPAALPLMLSGLGVLGFSSRRRKESI